MLLIYIGGKGIKFIFSASFVHLSVRQSVAPDFCCEALLFLPVSICRIGLFLIYLYFNRKFKK
jgi:hypothetical protein